MNEKENRKYDMMRQVADKLDEILCSYQGRSHQSVYFDTNALALFVSLLLQGEITMQEYSYEYDAAIYEDETVIRIYQELAPQTRWRIGRHTHIESIRMNALKQFAHIGTPVYDDQIYYKDKEAVLICGEFLPYEIIRLFAERQDIKILYIFPYPYRNEDEKAVYYSFEPTAISRDEMKRYMDEAFANLYRILEKNSKGIP